jgi:hypothetical protein
MRCCRKKRGLIQSSGGLATGKAWPAGAEWGITKHLKNPVQKRLNSCRQMSERGICHPGREPDVSHEETGGQRSWLLSFSREWWIEGGKGGSG